MPRLRRRTGQDGPGRVRRSADGGGDRPWGHGEPAPAIRYHRLTRAVDQEGITVFKNIVVGTDGSETAGAAVALAVELARDQGAKLHLVVGVHTADGGGRAGRRGQRVRPLGRGRLRGVAQRMLEEVAGDVKGLETEIHTGVG